VETSLSHQYVYIIYAFQYHGVCMQRRKGVYECMTMRSHRNAMLLLVLRKSNQNMQHDAHVLITSQTSCVPCTVMHKESATANISDLRAFARARSSTQQKPAIVMHLSNTHFFCEAGAYLATDAHTLTHTHTRQCNTGDVSALVFSLHALCHVHLTDP
jgi:hypothetical protein